MSDIELTFTFVVDEDLIRAHLGQRVKDPIAAFNEYYERFPSEAVHFIRHATKTTSVVARQR